MYLSREAHLSMGKAFRICGISDERVREVGVDDDRRLDVTALAELLERDRKDGLLPTFVCASAGTVNTGVIDPLNEIADVCKAHNVWLHIDGAYGAPAVLTKEYQWMSAAFAQADSLSLDPHKWLFAPFDVGCVLIRDSAATSRAFSLRSEYVGITQSDSIESYAFFDHGMDLSRRFRALKVWAILKTRGVDQIGEMIQRNIDLRKHLDERVAQHPRLERLGSGLSVSCFRYVPPGATEDGVLNSLNQRILTTLNAEGRVHLSATTLEGRHCLRACIVNFRTSRGDVDFLIDETLRVGDEIAQQK